MNLEYQISFGFVFGVLALVLAVVLFLWGFRRWRKPEIELLDLVYDKAARRLELFVVNEGEKQVYVNPSLRLVHFLNPDEWREKKSNGNGSGDGMLPGKSYQVDSVIKGYSLIGECPESVKVDSRSVRKIIYDLGDDLSLKVYDNIRVDMQYGFDGVLEERLANVMRVVLKDGVDSNLLEGKSTADKSVSPSFCLLPFLEDAESVVTPTLENSPEGPSFCSLSSSQDASTFVENEFPLQAVCVCCGKDKWLEWVVDGNHVCVDCKDFLGHKNRVISLLPESEAESFIQGFNSKSYEDRYVDLNNRQLEILSLLEHENNLTVKKISKLLSMKESTISSDLRQLMGRDLVGRIEVGNRYLYHMA
ncbi:MAG: MarR family transcriptional regulator [Candidatus Altiarchaeota archaeon]